MIICSFTPIRISSILLSSARSAKRLRVALGFTSYGYQLGSKIEASGLKMAPKQATLGYVKPTQKTLRCAFWRWLWVYRHRTDMIVFNRKFFGVPNGTKPAKPQQSKLAFSSKSTPAEDGDVKVETQAKTERAKKPGNIQNGDEDMQMSSDHDEPSHTNEVLDVKKESESPSSPKPGKRASAAVEMTQHSDTDEEPPTKRQKRKLETNESKTKSVEANQSEESTDIKSERVDNKTPPKKSAFSSFLKDGTQKPGKKNATHSKDKTKTGSTENSIKKIKQEPQPEGSEQDVAPIPSSTKETKEGSASAEDESESDQEADPESDEEKPEVAAKVREKVQSTLKTAKKDPYPDWEPGEPVPYAALCTTFSKIELTTKRLEIMAHCSLFLRQVLRLTPNDLLPTVQLMIGKLAADYAGIELGIGESLIMKAIGESTGRSLNIIKSDQKTIGDLGLVAAKSRSNQPTMHRPKPLTVRSVHEGLMAIAIIEGQGSQGRKIAGIKKLLSAADQDLAGKGLKGVDVTKDKGGPSESKFIVRTLEGKMRLGLADKTILVALAQAVVVYEISKKDDKMPSTDQIAKSESTLKSVYK